MSVFEKVTIKSLLKNKVRTIITIIGIILSTALFTGVTTAISTGINFIKENYEYVDGSWHGMIQNEKDEIIKKITESEEVKETVYLKQVGHGVVQNKNIDKPYIYIAGATSNFDKMLPVHLTSGVMPKNSSEIILPTHLFDEGGVTYQLGDEITLEVGTRMLDGYMLYPDDEYVCDLENNVVETLENTSKKTYKIVGFYERTNIENPLGAGYMAFTIDDEIDENSTYNIYFQMKKAKDIYKFSEINNINVIKNEDVLMIQGATNNKTLRAIFYILGAFLIILIMFGSVALIYNAFSISVSERTKQFGLLSSVGATKKQLLRMVFFEALIIGIIGIIIGLLVGTFGLWIVLKLLEGKLSMLSAFELPMKLHVSVVAILASVVISFITIFLSALIPAIRATQITAIEAIRMQKDIKAKKVKTPKVIYKLFGLPGVLANKNFKRNKRKYSATVISLIMSIILFILTSGFSTYLLSTVENSMDLAGYDIIYSLPKENHTKLTEEELLNKLSSTNDVKESTYVTRHKLYINIPNNVLTDEWVYDIGGSNIYVEGMDENITRGLVVVNFLEDAEYKKLLKKHGLNESSYFDKTNPLALAIDGYTVYSIKEDKFVLVNAFKDKFDNLEVAYENSVDRYSLEEIYQENGKTMYRFVSNFEEKEDIILPEEEALTKYNLSIGKIITEKPFYIEPDVYINLIYPESMQEVIMTELKENSVVDYMFTSSNHAKTFNEMKELLSNYGFSTTDLYDYASGVERSKDLVVIVKVFTYTFVGLISLIAMANVFNTISTNIALRKKEFAMLKSVGMTKKQFNKMMNLECLLYGTKSLLIGLPIAIALTLVMYLIITSLFEIPFALPFQAIILSIMGVYGIVFITMIYSMSKIKKESVIESLRKDAI